MGVGSQSRLCIYLQIAKDITRVRCKEDVIISSGCLESKSNGKSLHFLAKCLAYKHIEMAKEEAGPPMLLTLVLND